MSKTWHKSAYVFISGGVANNMRHTHTEPNGETHKHTRTHTHRNG